MSTRGKAARSAHGRAHRSGVLAPLLGIALMAGCTDGVSAPAEADLAEGDSLRLGRVHVVLEPTEGTELEDASAQLQVTARFAFVRGLDEDVARARTDMPILAEDLLSPSECSGDLAAAMGDLDPARAEPRELVLLDAGDLHVEIGTAQVLVPLSLVPDLLPYMSGVEYVYYGEAEPDDALGGSGVVVEAGGSQVEDLPPFSAEGVVPRELGLFATSDDLMEVARDALVLRWRGSGEGSIAVRLTPLMAGEPAGDDITCVFEDRGQTRVDLAVLRTLGLPSRTDALRVTASRATTTTFDAGEFVGSELVVERRSQLVIDL